MFQVLTYVYENYWGGDACPEAAMLERKLNAEGFDAEEIDQALIWLDGLSVRVAAQQTQLQIARAASQVGAALAVSQAAQALQPPQSPHSLRVYASAEQDHLGAKALGFICFLESAGVLPAPLREIVLDRAMAAPGGPVALDELKIIVLMVYWSLGQEPDALVLDELCDNSRGRLPH